MWSVKIMLSFSCASGILVLSPGPGVAVTATQQLHGLETVVLPQTSPQTDLSSLGDLCSATGIYTTCDPSACLHLVPKDMVTNSQMPCQRKP